MKRILIFFGILLNPTYSREAKFFLIRSPIKTFRSIDPNLPPQVKGGYPVVPPQGQQHTDVTAREIKTQSSEESSEESQQPLEELIVNNGKSEIDFWTMPQHQKGNVMHPPVKGMQNRRYGYANQRPIPPIRQHIPVMEIQYPNFYPQKQVPVPTQPTPVTPGPPIPQPPILPPKQKYPIIEPQVEPPVELPKQRYPVVEPPAPPIRPPKRQYPVIEPQVGPVIEHPSPPIDPIQQPLPNIQDPDGDGIYGIAGQDYPILNRPVTTFQCQTEPYPGYYTDVQTRCQVFSICQSDGRQDAFLCPNGTVFNQKYFVCDWWYHVNCDESVNYFHLNAEIGKSNNQINQDIENVNSYK